MTEPKMTFRDILKILAIIIGISGFIWGLAMDRSSVSAAIQKNTEDIATLKDKYKILEEIRYNLMVKPPVWVTWDKIPETFRTKIK